MELIFDKVSIPAKTTHVFTIQTKETMGVRKFVIKTDNPKDLWVIDIKMGNISQVTPGCTGIPVEGFLENSFMTDVRMDTLKIMQIASVCIENRSSETRTIEITISDGSPDIVDIENPEGEYFEVDEDDDYYVAEETPKEE